MSLIQQNIRDGKYKTTLQYPCVELYPDKEERKTKLKEYRTDVSRLEHEVFKADLFEEYGVAEHPKREKLWSMAWQRGHSSGLHEVAQEFEELVELLTTEVFVVLKGTSIDMSHVAYASVAGVMESREEATALYERLQSAVSCSLTKMKIK